MNALAEYWSEGARNVLLQTLALKPKEKVLVVYHDSKSDFADAFIEGGRRIGAEITSFNILEKANAVMTKELRDAIPGNKVFINLLRTSSDETPFRVALIYQELETGGRVAHSPGITEKMAKPLFDVDYMKLRLEIVKFLQHVDGAVSARVTTAKGTDLRMDLAGRGFQTDIFIQNGEIGNLPAGEVWCAPVEDTAEGRIVVDASIGDFGKVQSELTIDISKGRIAGTSCADASFLAAIREALKVDEMSDVIGEFGIGLNPSARITGNLLEDEKAYRTSHIAFGHNIDMIGGKNNSRTHRDFLFVDPTITFTMPDGKKLEAMRDGRLLV